MPPHALPWRHHVVPNAGYVLAGAITLKNRDTGARHSARAGEALAASVGVVYRGNTGEEGAEVVVTYAAAAGAPLSVPRAGQAWAHSVRDEPPPSLNLLTTAR